GEGERIPVDGTILSGRSTVDQSTLTGETLPVDKGPGDPVYTGSINQYGRMECRAERIGAESTYGQVLRLVAEAQHRKAPLQRTADRYAALFLPVVEIAAGLTLLAGYLLGWPDVWHRTVAVLVVACPCALVLATPAAIMASMAWLARHGVVIKGGAALERLARCNTVAFDKTGTLTLGRPELASIEPIGELDSDTVLRLAASVESASSHPLAVSVVHAAREKGLELLPVTEVQAQPGAGMSGKVAWNAETEATVLVGNARLLSEHGLDVESAPLQTLDDRGETPLLIALNGQLVGVLGLRDSVRPEAHDVIHDLKHLGIKSLALLTGDRAPAARLVAKKVHLRTVEAELLPADKALWI
ncbi:MAG TPA: heavy metal translocating P-type ATPase, partial [Isosphaeraceae bacterium]|nr:heavy metal translocating P-type ATPase [Isosphaeraceae bacterium]